LILGQDLYVAKRFFDIGTSKAPTATENQDLLEYELIRLLNLEWFLKHFFALAKEKQIEYKASKSILPAPRGFLTNTVLDIAVTEAFLV
jgi:heme O synthase-like polyprenyltransferase